MFQELSPIYSELVSLTVAVAPSDWTRLWLDVECLSASYAIGAYWERQDRDDVIFFKLPYEAGKLVWQAWKVSRSYNDDWSTAIFRVDRPDKLQITFGHQDLYDKSYSSIASQAAFRARTFGDRKINSTIDMSGAVSLTSDMLRVAAD